MAEKTTGAEMSSRPPKGPGGEGRSGPGAPRLAPPVSGPQSSTANSQNMHSETVIRVGAAATRR